MNNFQKTESGQLGRKGFLKRNVFWPGGSYISRLMLFLFLVFVSEAVVMLLIPRPPHIPLWLEIFIDSTLLVILLAPTFYFIIYRYLVGYAEEQKRIYEALGARERNYRLMMEAMRDPVYICSEDYKVLYLNPAMARRIGSDVTGKYCYQTIHHLETICPWCISDKTSKGKYTEYEVVSARDGRFYNVAMAPIFHLDGRVDKMVIMRDFTRYKETEESLSREININRVMAELSSALLSPRSIEDVSSLVLDSAQRLTGSPFGYVGFIDRETGYLMSPTLTRGIWEQCEVQEKTITFKEFSGLWGWVLENKKSLMTNKVNKDPRSTGIPEGHIPIYRFLSCPAMAEGKLLGQIALANADNDYEEKDMKLIESLADIYAIAIQNLRADENLRKARNELEMRVWERTSKLEESNRQLKKEIADHHATEAALQSSEEQLRHLSSLRLSAQEEERRAIALELHDGIGQSLSAIKFKIETTMGKLGEKESSNLQNALGSVVSMIQESVEEIRRICANLRPSMLDDLGVVATISWFFREFQKIYPGIHLEKEIRIEETDVPEALKTAVFRILQEGLNNIAKHSQANRVLASLRKEDGWLKMEIEDNGRGFDVTAALSAEKPAKGLGLGSMKERALLSGGSFEIESSLGHGARIGVWLPVENKH